MKSSSLPKDKLLEVLAALKEFPQKVIWKWEDKTLIVDKNHMYLSDWLPQVDILGNMKYYVYIRRTSGYMYITYIRPVQIIFLSYASSFLVSLLMFTGHSKTLAFYSHAGFGGTTEAIHYGVPMIAMPIVGDQPSNAAVIEESELGIQLQYRDLTKDNLVAALKTVLDPK